MMSSLIKQKQSLTLSQIIFHKQGGEKDNEL